MWNWKLMTRYSPILIVLTLAGCSLVTEPPDVPIPPLGKDLIINELFTIAPDKFYAYSWIELYNPTDKTIRWFDAIFPGTVVITGASGTARLINDAGQMQSDIPNAPAVTFYGVNFPYPDTGVIVGDNGFLKRLINVDGVYQFVDPLSPVPTTNTLRAVTGISVSLGSRVPTLYAAGDKGTILRTIDLGKNWAVQTIPAAARTKNVRAVKMGSVLQVYACGDSGLILSSERSGVWNLPTQFDPAYALTNFNTVGATGTNAETSWVGGSDGVILSSKNKGSTWFPDTSNTTSTLWGSYFLPGTMKAWMVGENGTIMYKDTTGRAWQPQQSGTTATLRAITFIDSMRGLIVGDGGTMLGTNNGGRRWQSISSGTSTNLHALYPMPLNVRISTEYVLQMLALRKEFLYDFATLTFNFDYIVRQDTGFVYFSPEFVPAIGLFLRREIPLPKDIPPFGFTLVNNDSVRLVEHTALGPGKPEQIDYSVGFYPDSTADLGFRPVLWSLLEAGEIRLLKIYTRLGAGGTSSVQVLDVVRWGGYRPTPDDYPQNQPAGVIPEWWSLARFSDDVGSPDSVQSTQGSFYLTDTPIPGYYSQATKPK